MKVTIIRSDNTVYVDGVSKIIDCSALPTFVHAVQWTGEKGWIEFAEDGEGRKHANMSIIDMSSYQFLIEQWQIQHAKDQEELRRATEEAAKADNAS